MKNKNHSWSFHNLLFWLLLYILISPMLMTLPLARVFVSMFMSVALFSAVYVVNREGKLFSFTLVLMAGNLVLLWGEVFGLIDLSLKGGSVLLCAYLGLLIYSMGRFIFSAREVSASLISGALCLYLIFGMFWGSVYHLLSLSQPGSFAGEILSRPENHVDALHYFQYFSFVTLTTLGYGDIVPKTAIATAFCQMEAILGQFFMAVLVARLVGIQVAREFGAKCVE